MSASSGRACCPCSGSRHEGDARPARRPADAGRATRRRARPLPEDHARRRRGRGDVPGVRHPTRARHRGTRGPARTGTDPAADRPLPVEGPDQARARGRVRGRRPRHPEGQGVRPHRVPRAGRRGRPRRRGDRRGRAALAPAAARARGGAAAEPRGQQSSRERSRALRAVSLLATATSSSVDTTVVAAFAVGFVSFVSPCVLPLVPGYLSTISGVSFAELQAGRRRIKVLGPAVLFCLAFTAMFIALGVTATGLGQTLQDHRQTLRHVAGIVIAAMGVLFIATLFVPLLNREWRPELLLRRASAGGPIVAGLAFAVAWLPCTGPTLGAILTAASTQATVGRGAVLLTFYALGLAVPFLLSALVFTRVAGLFRFFRRHFQVITVISGVILIAMGVLLFTNELTRLNSQA